MRPVWVKPGGVYVGCPCGRLSHYRPDGTSRHGTIRARVTVTELETGLETKPGDGIMKA